MLQLTKKIEFTEITYKELNCGWCMGAGVVVGGAVIVGGIAFLVT